jgi:4-amino-4-deoxy-L-arabinose transferase-like glycosyltransferase
LLGVAIAKLAVHLISSQWLAYGYMTDELYYLDSVDRLDWGYVDHPPFSIALLAVVRALLGDSLLAIRLVPALLGSAVVVLTGAMARELGGGRAGQGLAALAALAAPLHLGIDSFYSMNAIDVALWALCSYWLLRLINGASPRLWLALGFAMGVGLLNKISLLWFGLGLTVGLVMTPQRRWLATRWPWLAAAIALAVFAPHLAWQVQNDWPWIEFMRNAASEKIGGVSPLVFVGTQLVAMNPVSALLLLAGLAYFFAAPEARRYRLLGWIWLTVMALLLASGAARIHYMAPAHSVLLAAGGCAVVRLATARRWRFAVPGLASTISVIGLVAAPLALPLMPPERLLDYYGPLLARAPQERQDSGVFPMQLALRFHGQAAVRSLTRAYRKLTPEERKGVGILTWSFGSTGAVNFFGPEAGLPPAIGVHNQYWLWGPESYSGEKLLVLTADGDLLRRWFARVEPVEEVDCAYCMPFLGRASVYLCRKPRRPLRELWPEMKLYL